MEAARIGSRPECEAMPKGYPKDPNAPAVLARRAKLKEWALSHPEECMNRLRKAGVDGHRLWRDDKEKRLSSQYVVTCSFKRWNLSPDEVLAARRLLFDAPRDTLNTIRNGNRDYSQYKVSSAKSDDSDSAADCERICSTGD